MTQRLTDMQINRVSLVDKGANARVIAILKRDEEGAMTGAAAEADATTPAGIVGLLQKALDWVRGRDVSVEKTATFAEVVAGQVLRDALWDSWYTLEDVLWGAIYAVDADGADLTLEAKQALVAQDLDEFKAYLLAQMASGVQKRAAPAEHAQRSLEALVAKVGRKVSGDRLGRLQAAADALNGVLAEVVDVEEPEEGEEEPVDKSELVSAITEAVEKANEPLVARIDALEKIAKGAAEADDDAPATLDTVVTVLEKFGDRLEALESTKGVRKSADGQEGGSEPVKKSVFKGLFG